VKDAASKSAAGATMRAPRRRRRVKRIVMALVVCVALGAAAFAVLSHLYPFPIERLAQWPASPQVLDRYGRPMLQLVGADDHWRMPVRREAISPWLIQATIAVEDERFAWHPGVDAVAVGRAVLQNAVAGEVVSGASTLTMQICRMMDDRPRTLGAKAIEAFRALQLERLMSKDELIELYLNIAPYGGNVRGVEAASWRYFGRPASELSLAEAAMLAGLPQAPDRHRPDRDLASARARQATVLRRMVEQGMITEAQRAEAARQPIQIVDRGAGSSRPRVCAPSHAAWLALRRGRRVAQTTIDIDVQRLVEAEAAEHAARLPEGTQVAVVVIDVEAAAVRAMVGSVDRSDAAAGDVNGATAWRSPGSALKPFVYAAAMEAGRLNHASVLHDVAIERGGWSPTNFDRRFRGEVQAGEALRRSLNVPAILVAEGTGLSRCVGLMEAAGVSLRDDAARRGGLACVVGAVEVRLIDLTNAYATLARGGVRRAARLLDDDPSPARRVMRAEVCASIDAMLATTQRRPMGMDDLADERVPWFMWKTGTSSARRDAWAVGHNGRFAVGVWVGRFSGSSRAEYVGRDAAEPLLARLMSLPTLRVDGGPAEPPLLAVRWPLAPPREAAERLAITSPRDGARLLALEGDVAIECATNGERGVTWFVNGVATALEAGRVRLPIGRHEVRCVDRNGRSDAAVVTVAAQPSERVAARR